MKEGIKSEILLQQLEALSNVLAELHRKSAKDLFENNPEPSID